MISKNRLSVVHNMRCPFGFLGSSAPAPAPDGKCPFAGLLAAPAGPGNNTDEPAEPGLRTTPPADCPAPEKERSGPAAAAASAAKPAVCPYGFGSARKDDVLAALQCARYDLQLSHASALHPAHVSQAEASNPYARALCRCRGLYYDAVRTSCGHFFCRACITRDGTQPLCDCLLCGADIASVDAEPQLQGPLPPNPCVQSAGTAMSGSAQGAAANGSAQAAGGPWCTSQDLVHLL